MPDQDLEFTRPQLTEDVAESKSPEQLAKEAYERGRKDGFKLAAGTAGHFIGNKLALTLGYAELLTISKTIDPNAKEMAGDVLEGAIEATKYLKRLASVENFNELANLGGPDIVDLDKIKTEEEDKE